MHNKWQGAARATDLMSQTAEINLVNNGHFVILGDYQLPDYKCAITMNQNPPK